MWTETTRPKYERSELRYASDLTDAEWQVMGPLLPARKPSGHPRTTALRAVVDAILSMARTGWQWRMLPKDFPPRSTVQGYFYAWRADGVLRGINQQLLLALRTAQGRDASPSAGVIDSQSVKTQVKRRSAWVRCGQVDQGAQAPHPHRHRWASRRRHGSRRPNPGPRRRGAAVGFGPPGLSLAAPCLRRARLRRTQTHKCSGQARPIDARDHQALRCRKRLQDSAPPMGCATHLRVARPQPPARQGLRGIPRKR